MMRDELDPGRARAWLEAWLDAGQSAGSEAPADDPGTHTHDQEEPVYIISVAARLLEMHPQTLRMYERVGLVQPQRSEHNIRLYCEGDIERLRKIKHLTQDLGVNLAGVEIVLNLLDRIEELDRTRDEIRRELEQEIMEKLRRWAGRSAQAP